MLYDPKWEAETNKPELWTPRHLIAWLETMPPEKEYCYTSNGHCLLAQYLMAHGWPKPALDSIYADDLTTRARRKLPEHFNDIAIWHPQTFGGALARARAAFGLAEGAG
jgi:hypothetical protein